MTDPIPSLRLLRAKEVDRLTGTGETQRYRLEAAGLFPRRVKITDKAVAWVEGEVLAWIAGRMALRDEAAAREDNLPPAARHRLRQAEQLHRSEEAEIQADLQRAELTERERAGHVWADSPA
jgi:prophage regulatory protein